MSLLPPGTFVLFRISPGTTEESMAEFLTSHGLDITPEMVDVREPGSNSCMVSVPSVVLCQLLSWAIDNDFLGDRVPLPQPRALKPPQGG